MAMKSMLASYFRAWSFDKKICLTRVKMAARIASKIINFGKKKVAKKEI